MSADAPDLTSHTYSVSLSLTPSQLIEIDTRVWKKINNHTHTFSLSHTHNTEANQRGNHQHQRTNGADTVMVKLGTGGAAESNDDMHEGTDWVRSNEGGLSTDEEDM